MKWVWLALFVLCCLAGVVAWQYVPRDRVREWTSQQYVAYANHALASKTTHLPPVDRVQVCVLQACEGPLPPGAVIFPAPQRATPAIVLRTGEVIGAEAESLAALWRSRTFQAENGYEGTPTYGLRFYRNGELVFETCLAWEGSCTASLLGETRYCQFEDPGLELADRLQQIVPVDVAVRADLEFWRGYQAWMNNRLPQSVPAFERSLQLDPQEERSRYMLARTQRELGALDRAIVEYDHLLRSETSMQDGSRDAWLAALMRQAEVYHEAGQTERALSNLAIVRGQADVWQEHPSCELLLSWKIHTDRGELEAAAALRARLASEHQIEDPLKYFPLYR